MPRNRDRYRTTSGQEGRQLVFAVPPVIVKSILDQVCMMRFKKRGTRRSNANVCSAQSAACARFNGGREEGGTGALMSSARHFFFLPPLASEILSLGIYTIVARRDHRERWFQIWFMRVRIRDTWRGDNRAPFFFNSMAIMQSLLKTITIVWEGGIPVAGQINSRGARYHQDNQSLCVCVCVWVGARGCIRQITDWID